MPAGLHPILNQTRLAVERRARGLLAQLQEPESLPVAEAVDDEGGEPVEESRGGSLDLDSMAHRGGT
jgi:hypothetical protein